MKDDKTSAVDTLIDTLCKNMEIDRHSIRHITLGDGTQFIGEIFSDEPEEDLIEIIEDDVFDIVFFYPLRIEEDVMLGQGQAQYSRYFVPLNPYTDDPFVSVKETFIRSPSFPSKTIMVEYLKHVGRFYFDMNLDEDMPTDDIKLLVQTNNVVQFPVK